ncbi:hypothetical protein OA58_10095 [Microcystis aeruginosa NIES-88]|nr:hypothetical protein OA58_10095 [Microcystis aeruginosa NIES-88]TRT62995.1 MAG: hypothetical protein EWV67_12495 [Microcystis sp. M_QC_C_20170808_M2Col]TRT69740.1 MAG: hypothetical protein EWV68_08110 [Microcystis sp. M_QC_C_20170808_M9Col]
MIIRDEGQKQEVGKWGSGEVGKWGSGEVGKWGGGVVGKWGVGCGVWGGGEVGARAFVLLFSTGSLNTVQLRRRTTNL